MHQSLKRKLANNPPPVVRCLRDQWKPRGLLFRPHNPDVCRKHHAEHRKRTNAVATGAEARRQNRQSQKNRLGICHRALLLRLVEPLSFPAVDRLITPQPYPATALHAGREPSKRRPRRVRGYAVWSRHGRSYSDSVQMGTTQRARRKSGCLQSGLSFRMQSPSTISITTSPEPRDHSIALSATCAKSHATARSLVEKIGPDRLPPRSMNASNKIMPSLLSGLTRKALAARHTARQVETCASAGTR